VHAALRGQASAIKAALGGAQQEIPQFGGEPAGADRGPQPLRPAGGAVARLAAQQPADLEQLLGAGQQQRRLLAGEHELAADERESVAVERHRQGLAQRPVQPQRDALAQFLGRLATEGQHQHAAGIDAALRDAIDDRLHDRRRLASAGPGQHQQRAARVPDDPPLRGIQARGNGRERGRLADEPVRGLGGFHLVMNSSRPQ